RGTGARPGGALRRTGLRGVPKPSLHERHLAAGAAQVARPAPVAADAALPERVDLLRIRVSGDGLLDDRGQGGAFGRGHDGHRDAAGRQQDEARDQERDSKTVAHAYLGYAAGYTSFGIRFFTTKSGGGPSIQ